MDGTLLALLVGTTMGFLVSDSNGAKGEKGVGHGANA